ncbi:MAG: hypothetical protein U9Q20_00755 [Campylobacterota bacterium]|nr:hypothetical protein [Campylobacterota bacterium]
MTYRLWYEDHSKKHKNIVDKLSNLTDDEIIEYFDYNNMVVHEKDFCILYKQNQKCHDTAELNCYLCACPNFRVAEVKSYCEINSKDGSSIKSDDGFVHQDCSKCIVPHKVDYIKRSFNRDWKIAMKDTFL